MGHLNFDPIMYIQVWWYAVSVYLVFTVTISVFPALLSQIVSAAPNHSGWTGQLPHYLTMALCVCVCACHCRYHLLPTSCLFLNVQHV